MAAGAVHPVLTSQHGGAPASPVALIARNAPLVIVGEALPLAAAVLAMPVLAASLGVDRLGVLSLAWVVIGYFSLFDLGIGRAVTRLVAARLADGRPGEVPPLVASALALLLALGCAGGVLLAVLSPWLVDRALQVPDALRGEARIAFLVLAASVPLVVLASGLRGVLEAERRFATLAVLRIALGMISFLGPLLVLPLSRSLVAVVLVLAVGRVVLLVVTAALARHVLVWPRRGQCADRDTLRELLHFGGWLTVTNVVSPLLVLLDRFVVGAIVSVGAVAYYATPLEVVQRTGVIPVAIGTVVFPAIAAAAVSALPEARALLSVALRASLAGIFPLLFVLALWAPQGLELWLGEGFARESIVVVRWVTPALLLNSLGCAALFALQAAGRPDLPGRFHLMELVLYVPLLWWLASRLGLEGAAIAWSARVAIDAALLLAAAAARFALGTRVLAPVLATAAAGLALLVLAQWVGGTTAKAVATLAVPVAYLGGCFAGLLTRDERTAVRRLVRRGH
ncbi:flippase [Candidatus Binatia bacterium]|nr:flippase [Candidatus Binatia bacterium]